MAKSKLQKREEALKRQRESFMTQHLPRLNEVATAKPYDAEDHALLYGRAVNAAHAANCDLHGNMLNCNFYRSGNSDNAQYMALNHTLYTLEEMKEITGYDESRSLYKLAYGTPPFVPEVTKHYGVSYSPTAEDIIAAGKTLGIDVAPNFTREEMMNAASFAVTKELAKHGLCTPMISGINDIAKREALDKQLASDRFEQHKGDFTDIDNIPVISSLIDGGLRRGELLVIGAGSPPLSNYRGLFAHKAPFIVTVPPEPAEDPNRADIIMDATSSFGNNEAIDYLAGKIGYAEALSISGQRAQKTDPNWVPEIDGAALLAFHQSKLSTETYLKIRARKENGLSDAECLELIKAEKPPVLSPGSKWITDNF